MQVVTVTTDIYHKNLVNILRPSCASNNLRLIVLETQLPSLPSYRYKDVLLDEYLREVSPEEIIFFTDANDTMFLSSEDEILKKYRNFNAELVFSSEINCWPDPTFKKKYVNCTKHFKFLNTGAFIGRAGFLRSIYKSYPVLETALGSYNWSNQFYWHNVYFEQSTHIKIDHDCEIFYNTANEIKNMKDFTARLQVSDESKRLLKSEKRRLDKEITFENNRIVCNLTNSRPCHLHFPGPIAKMISDEGYFSKIQLTELERHRESN